jgi:hypothetical protein
VHSDKVPKMPAIVIEHDYINLGHSQLISF